MTAGEWRDSKERGDLCGWRVEPVMELMRSDEVKGRAFACVCVCVVLYEENVCVWCVRESERLMDGKASQRGRQGKNNSAAQPRSGTKQTSKEKDCEAPSADLDDIFK
jgi:hypothetical protein